MMASLYQSGSSALPGRLDIFAHLMHDGETRVGKPSQLKAEESYLLNRGAHESEAERHANRQGCLGHFHRTKARRCLTLPSRTLLLGHPHGSSVGRPG